MLNKRIFKYYHSFSFQAGELFSWKASVNHNISYSISIILLIENSRSSNSWIKLMILTKNFRLDQKFKTQIKLALLNTLVILKTSQRSITIFHNQQIMIQHISKKNIPILNEKYTIFEIKQSLPADLRAYFTVLNDYRKNLNDIKLRKNRFLNAKFIEAFRKLSGEERSEFLYKTLKLLQPRILLSDQAQQYQLVMPKSHRTTLLCAMRTKILVAVTYWVPVRFIFDGNKKEITLISQDSQQVLDLRKSLIRKSKDNDNCFVIIPYSMNFNEKKHKFKFWIPQQKFKPLYDEIWKAILLCHTQQLLKTLAEPNKIISKYQKNYWETLIDTEFEQHLNNPILKQYFKEKAQMLECIMTVSFDFLHIYSQNTQIYKSSIYPQTYFLKERYKMHSSEAKRLFLQNFRNNHPYLIFSEKKQSIKNKYELREERYLISSRLLQSYLIREVDLRPEISDTVFMVEVKQQDKTKSFIHFMRIQIITINSKESQLRILAAFNQYQNLSQQIIILFLEQYCQMITKKNKVEEKLQKFDLQVINNIHYTVVQDDLNPDDLPLTSKQKQHIVEQEILENRYLTHHHLVTPSTEKNYFVVKVNRLIKEWVRKSNGGLRCINEDLMHLHRETCKKFAAKIGLSVLRNPMKLLNMSLPVGIFKAESEIQSLGRIFSYAPLLLQSAATQKDPKERMAQCTTYLVSIGILTVTASKSFNPILGQTYQAWIGGCPIYIEQISHHPPIMGYYIVGRGYKLYGSFQLKPTIVIDGANAQVQSTSKIHFDDGTIIEYTFPKAHVIGVMLKDRQYNYSGKAYVLDRKNLLMSQLNFGPKSRSIFSGNSDPDDYVYGSLYQITKQYQQKFRQSNIPFFKPKQDSLKQLNSFDGFWTNSFRINGVEVINFWTDLPCQVIEEEFPLPSNSLYREDLILLKQGDMDASQSMKQKMEQSQRRDRKLRKEFQEKQKQNPDNH